MDSAFHWLQSQQSCSYARAALELAPPPMADELSGDTKRKLSDQGRSLLMASMQLQKQAAAAAVAPESGTSFEATTVTLQRIEGEGLGLLMDREGDPPNMHIWVDDLVPDSVSAMCGKIKLGDTLAQVNGQLVQEMAFEAVMGGLGQPTVELVFTRRKDGRRMSGRSASMAARASLAERSATARRKGSVQVQAQASALAKAAVKAAAAEESGGEPPVGRKARRLSLASQKMMDKADKAAEGGGAGGEGGGGKDRRGSFLDHLSGPMKKIKVTLERNEAGLGIVLDHTGTPPQQHIWVDELVEGTPAAKCKKIRMGDTLAEVNGENIRWLPIEEVVKLLGTHVVKLTFLRRKDGEELLAEQKEEEGAKQLFDARRFSVAGAQEAEDAKARGEMPARRGSLGAGANPNAGLAAAVESQGRKQDEKKSAMLRDQMGAFAHTSSPVGRRSSLVLKGKGGRSSLTAGAAQENAAGEPDLVPPKRATLENGRLSSRPSASRSGSVKMMRSRSMPSGPGPALIDAERAQVRVPPDAPPAPPRPSSFVPFFVVVFQLTWHLLLLASLFLAGPVCPQELAAFEACIRAGADISKHGRRGKPHTRTIFCPAERPSWVAPGSENFRCVCWCKPIKPGAEEEKMPSEESSLPLHTVMAVRPGKTTDVLSRAEDAPEDLCFSLVSPARTLDIQCRSVEQRDMLLRGFQVRAAPLPPSPRFPRPICGPSPSHRRPQLACAAARLRAFHRGIH